MSKSIHIVTKSVFGGVCFLCRKPIVKEKADDLLLCVIPTIRGKWLTYICSDCAKRNKDIIQKEK